MTKNDQSLNAENQGGEIDWRLEHDSMGEVRVPKGALWSAQTQRAVENFPISGKGIEKSLIIALAEIKRGAAIVNAKLGIIEKTTSEAIVKGAEEIIKGEHLEAFPVDVFQTGSGTSSNMNMNEVLANLSSKITGGVVKPNDDVNASQSSNDVFPTAMHVACATAITSDLIPALEHLSQTLGNKADEFKEVVKSGRTHLMDATPVTLGQEFGGYSAAIAYGIERLNAALVRVLELPLGGTAVGTGLNAPEGFATGVIAELSNSIGLGFYEARNHFEAQSGRDALVEASSMVKTIAVSLYKIANDLRWMSSGPRCGLGEIHLPDLQPGSSIMPGKVNPVVPEAVCQVVAQVIGNDAAVAFGGAAGNLELNVMLPVIARNLLESIRLVASVSRALADKCVSGIEADVERCRNYALSSPSVGTALNP
ncbi:MAG: class II fumarate hydratase, partial [Acidimicrobiales bacterium]|nr:class II fumarate hydratase [Acidimicrobiales bacterium]